MSSVLYSLLRCLWWHLITVLDLGLPNCSVDADTEQHSPCLVSTCCPMTSYELTTSPVNSHPNNIMVGQSKGHSLMDVLSASLHRTRVACAAWTKQDSEKDVSRLGKRNAMVNCITHTLAPNAASLGYRLLQENIDIKWLRRSCFSPHVMHISDQLLPPHLVKLVSSSV